MQANKPTCVVGICLSFMKSLANLKTHLCQQRMLVVLILGFASGLPLGLTGVTLQAWYTVENVDIVTIGFLGLVGQPYVYKFLWAPFMDRYKPINLGRRRGWLFITQLLLIGLLVVMAFFEPSTTPLLLAILALMLAVLSATQDIVIDAYRTEILPAKERGTGAAMAVAGYRIAMLTSGGLALIIADIWGFKATYLLMAILMGIGLIATLKAQEPKCYSAPPLNFKAACVDPFIEFLTRKNAILLLFLVVLYKLGDAFAGTLTTAFLLRGVGFSLIDVGAINKTVGLIATLCGVFCGGIMLSRVGLYKALLWFGVVQAFSNLTYMALAYVGQDYTLMIGAVFLENFGGGLGTAAFIALIMSLCNMRYTATQYALLSALSAIGRVFVGPAAGLMVDSYGWINFFLASLMISIPGLVLLWWLKDTIIANEKGQIEPQEVVSSVEPSAG